MHELPLVFFTVFAQMSAGLVFVAACCYLFQRNEVSFVKVERVNVLALIIMAIGMIIASFHLGQPLRALNVIFGIGRSPMRSLFHILCKLIS